ncbi:hypothetical protein EVG20_g3660 [Dentipellis fragilis]|uniref:Carboxylic ester hydrolase n=1 Tax=Dentipellis fragilis TaxID=205917 RepID=A0A4Y9Z2X0_9AGAM|nr:hypothetical protein EVG20_g3660 [Dentipellis fragilis]
MRMAFGVFDNFLALAAGLSFFSGSFALHGSDGSLVFTSGGAVVDLGYAAYAGSTTSPTGQPNAPVVFFGGIPYAKAPVGDLRFRAPQNLDESGHNGTVVNAMSFAPPCIQQPAVNGVGSEVVRSSLVDCLRLNVWKPAKATAKSKLPVAIYIYGGGFFAGNTATVPMYDWVAQHTSGLVAVSISYRVNVLGFLAGSAVHTDGDFNAGMLDQRVAIEWVQRHIDKFGGDPEQVTIIGESAGGASVVHQIVAYGGARGAPFKRAIAQSIGYGSMINPLSTQSEDAFGCSRESKSAALACLRNASLENIITGVNTLEIGATVPVVDGTLIPDYPSHLIAQGRFSEVDFIGGHCSNDGRTFARLMPDQYTSDADVINDVFSRWPYVTNATQKTLFDFYPKVNATGSPFHSYYDVTWTMDQDAVYGCMDQFLANKMLAKGKKNVFTFRWNAPNPVALAATPWEGVMHGSDVFFLFNGSTGAGFTPFNQSEALLSKEAIAYWTSFVSTGNPSTQKESPSPAWLSFTGSSGTSRHRIVPTIGNETATGTVLEVIPEFEVERCALWMEEYITAQTKV